jgi:hypothetical protein
MHGAIPLFPPYIFMMWYFIKHRDNFRESYTEFKFKEVGGSRKKHE